MVEISMCEKMSYCQLFHLGRENYLMNTEKQNYEIGHRCCKRDKPYTNNNSFASSFKTLSSDSRRSDSSSNFFNVEISDSYFSVDSLNWESKSLLVVTKVFTCVSN